MASHVIESAAKLFTLEEVAARLSVGGKTVTERSVRRWARQGATLRSSRALSKGRKAVKLAVIASPGRLLVREADLETFLADLTEASGFPRPTGPALRRVIEIEEPAAPAKAVYPPMRTRKKAEAGVSNLRFRREGETEFQISDLKGEREENPLRRDPHDPHKDSAPPPAPPRAGEALKRAVRVGGGA